MSRWSRWRGRGQSRRAFLGGAAAMVTLPFLPSLRRGAWADDHAPQRIVWWFAPNGMHMPAWTPDGEGAGMSLSPILQPLSRHRDALSVLTGLTNVEIDFGGGGVVRPPHASATSGWLTCAPVQQDTTRAGRSVDQLIARRVGPTTPFPSIQLGTEGALRTGNCDVGYPCTYQQTVSWADSGSPLPQLTDPRVLFDRLFAGTHDGDAAAERARRLRWRASVLDTVRADAASLNLQLGAEDRQRLDGYLTSVRELETRLDLLASAPPCDPGVDPPTTPVDLEARVDMMSELMVLALSCDLTRVITFMMGNGQSNASYSFLGVEGGHHSISHHGGDAGQQAKLQTINTWEVERFAAFLSRLEDVPDGDGTLLDQCAVVFGCGISDGDSHSLDDLPTVVAGRAGGALRPAGHLDLGRRRLSDLHLTLLDATGTGESQFGRGSGPIEELLA